MVALEKLHVGRMRLLSSSTDVSASVVNDQYREITDEKVPMHKHVLRRLGNQIPVPCANLLRD